MGLGLLRGRGIRGSWSLVVIEGHWWSLVVIGGHWWSFGGHSVVGWWLVGD